jgi:hypothetical protein
MGIYLSALQIFLSKASETKSQELLTSPASPETTNKPENALDEFISQNNSDPKQNDKNSPRNIFEKISQGGKDLINYLSDGANEIVEKTKKVFEELPKKFQIAQKEHEQKIAKIETETQEAKKIVEKKPSEIFQGNQKLSPAQIREFKEFLRNLYDRKLEERLEQARQEALKLEQERIQREVIARRQAEEAKTLSNLLAEKKKEEDKTKIEKLQAKASTPFMVDLIRRYSHLLDGIEITEGTTENHLVKFLVKSSGLSLQAKQEILVRSGQYEAVRKFIENSQNTLNKDNLIIQA